MSRSRPQPTRVVVVGAGVVGLLAAIECALAGHRVTVVEQSTAPNPAATSSDQHRVVRAWHPGDPEATDRAATLHRSWLRWQAVLGVRLYRRTGVLVVTGADEAETGRRLLRAVGVTAALLHPGAPAERLPHLRLPRHAAGLLEHDAGVLLAHRTLTAATRWLRHHPTARVLPQHRVTAVDADRAAVRLADGRTLDGDLLFVAAGPWSRDLLGGQLPEPVRLHRQSLLYCRPPADLTRAWAGTPPVLLRTGPVAGGWFLPPGDGTDLKLSGPTVCRPADHLDDRAPDATTRDVLDDLLRSVVVHPDRYLRLRVRHGHYLAGRDTGGPVFGRLGGSAAPTLAYAACGGGGFKTAPLIAHQVARAAARLGEEHHAHR